MIADTMLLDLAKFGFSRATVADLVRDRGPRPVHARRACQSPVRDRQGVRAGPKATTLCRLWRLCLSAGLTGGNRALAEIKKREAWSAVQTSHGTERPIGQQTSSSSAPRRRAPSFLESGHLITAVISRHLLPAVLPGPIQSASSLNFRRRRPFKGHGPARVPCSSVGH